MMQAHNPYGMCNMCDTFAFQSRRANGCGCGYDYFKCETHLAVALQRLRYRIVRLERTIASKQRSSCLFLKFATVKAAL